MAKQIELGTTKGSACVESWVDGSFPNYVVRQDGMGAGVARLLCLRHQGTKRQVQL